MLVINILFVNGKAYIVGIQFQLKLETRLRIIIGENFIFI